MRDWRDLAADWNRWSPAERLLAVALGVLLLGLGLGGAWLYS